MRFDIDNPPGDQHIRHVPLTILSKLSTYSGLIISIVLVILFVIRQYVFEFFLLRRIYGIKYTQLNDTDRRGFVNHHIAGGTKLLILLVAAYPFIDVAFRYATLNTPFAPGWRVTLGDVLVVSAQVLIGMYIFELLYRVKISHISSMHHIGTIMVGQAAIALSLSLPKEKDATVEFILCTVWGESVSLTKHWGERKQLHTKDGPGAFDIVCELLPHIAIILYRVHPTSHLFLQRLFLFACITTFFGTVCETIVIFYLFGSLWQQWQLVFKIVTPVLHCAFSATQLHGSRIFYKMYKRQCGFLNEAEEPSGREQGEAGEKAKGEIRDVRTGGTTVEDGVTVQAMSCETAPHERPVSKLLET